MLWYINITRDIERRNRNFTQRRVKWKVHSHKNENKKKKNCAVRKKSTEQYSNQVYPVFATKSSNVVIALIAFKLVENASRRPTHTKKKIEIMRGRWRANERNKKKKSEPCTFLACTSESLSPNVFLYCEFKDTAKWDENKKRENSYEWVTKIF